MAIVTKFVEDIVSIFGDEVELTEEKKNGIVKLVKKFYASAKKGGAKDAAKKGAAKGAAKKSDNPRPPNAYISFSMSVRESVKKANPEMNPKQLTSEIARKWKEESAANTETYKTFVKDAQKAMEEYKKTKSESSESESEPESESEKPEKKKRVPSAYNIFFSLKYAEFSEKGMSSADAKKEISKVWGEMTPEQKDEYKDKELSPKKVKKVAEKKPAKKEEEDEDDEEDKKEVEVKPLVKKTKKSKEDEVVEEKPLVKKTKKVVEEVKEDVKKDEKKPVKKDEKKEVKKDEKKEVKKDVKKPAKVEDDEESSEDEDDDFMTPPPKKSAK